VDGDKEEWSIGVLIGWKKKEMFTTLAFFAVSGGVLAGCRRRLQHTLNARRGLYSLSDVKPCLEDPLCIKSKVIKGFGRGGKLLGCPTANLDDSEFGELLGKVENGVYYGWARLGNETYKMVSSIGFNPYFHNTKRTIEPHILHKFDKDFYGEELSIVICGYIRPELDFDSMEALIEAIENDKVIGSQALDDEKYKKLLNLL